MLNRGQCRRRLTQKSVAFYESRLRALADQLAGRGPFSVEDALKVEHLPRCRVESSAPFTPGIVEQTG
jgi:hypothetical protein